MRSSVASDRVAINHDAPRPVDHGRLSQTRTTRDDARRPGRREARDGEEHPDKTGHRDADQRPPEQLGNSHSEASYDSRAWPVKHRSAKDSDGRYAGAGRRGKIAAAITATKWRNPTQRFLFDTCFHAASGSAERLLRDERERVRSAARGFSRGRRRPLKVGQSDATAGPENLNRRCERVGTLAGESCYIPPDMAPIRSITVQVEVGGPQTAQLLVAQTGWALMSLPETEPGVATYSLYVGVANPDADVQARHLEALDGALANGRWEGKRISNGVVMTGQTNPIAASGVLYRATSDEAAARARTVAPHDLEASDRVFLGTCAAFRQTNVFLTAGHCVGDDDTRLFVATAGQAPWDPLLAVTYVDHPRTPTWLC